MPRPWVELRCWIRFRGPRLLIGALLWAAVPAWDQLPDPPGFPVPPSRNGGRNPLGSGQQDDEMGIHMRRAEKEAARRRNLERQKLLASDANRIVELAQSLRSAVSVNPAERNSSMASKRAEEIEKLARNVKNRMKCD